MKNMKNYLLRRGSHHVQPSIPVSKDKWNTKEGTGNLMNNTSHVLRYGTSQAKVTSNNEKIKCVALAIDELYWSEGIRQAGRIS